ncbi:hypothetical protein [Flavobacterium sediminis]|nr:hypothetical protein [Flavobacterium sediminis]
MSVLKKEENLTFSYKDFSISANGQAIRTLAGLALTLVVIAGVVSVANKR